MAILIWVLKYMMWGTLVGLLMDFLNRNNPDSTQRFSNRDRITIVFVWPIAVATFVYHFIKASGGK